MTGRYYFEDFAPGRVFELGARTLSEGEITGFASEWDPQAFHLDGSMASGWQTVCVWMRLYVDEVLSRAAMLTAPGVEEVRWLRPVRPGCGCAGARRSSIRGRRRRSRTVERSACGAS